MLKWSVHQLYKLQKKGLQINEDVDLYDLVQNHPDLREITPVHVQGHADISSMKVIFHLTITGEMTLPCARTLVDVKYPFEIRTSETFLFSSDEYETSEQTHVVQGEVIDLMPIIHELVLLEIPLQVFSDEEENKQESAPQEGKFWKLIKDEEQQNKIDPRLASLAKLLDKKENDS